MTKNIAIIGAGISGMSTAYFLMNKGYSVTIYAKAFSPNITSNKAAAFWFPYHIRNDKRGIKWCSTSYDYYKAFAANAETGISMAHLIKVLRKDVEEAQPLWISFIPEGAWRLMDENELQQDFVKGYDVIVPLIETQIFLPYLYRQLLQNGVTFLEQEISDLKTFANGFDLVINCSALGSKKLCSDDELIPVRGQVALLAPIEGLPVYLDNETPSYIVPRKDAVIVGGTYEEYEETETTEPATIERLLNNAYKAFPQLRQQKVIGTWAGLRAYRPDVRVEHEAGTNIIHNYGHGGSGFTLAFGCAEEVLNIISQHIFKA